MRRGFSPPFLFGGRCAARLTSDRKHHPHRRLLGPGAGAIGAACRISAAGGGRIRRSRYPHRGASISVPSKARWSTAFAPSPCWPHLMRSLPPPHPNPSASCSAQALKTSRASLRFLHQRFGVLGCSVEALRACKDPQIFFPVLDELGIAHPETRMTPPDAPEGWLSKRIGGSGGRHIRDCNSQSRAKPRRYFQKLHRGRTHLRQRAHSARWHHDRNEPAMDLAQRRSALSLRRRSEPDGRQRGMSAARCLTPSIRWHADLNLRGLASFDFIVASGTAHLLEINPRPGATLDVFDDAEGALFKAHVAACQDNPHGTPRRRPATPPKPPPSCTPIAGRSRLVTSTGLSGRQTAAPPVRRFPKARHSRPCSPAPKHQMPHRLWPAPAWPNSKA